jgi:hypothetical protein
VWNEYAREKLREIEIELAASRMARARLTKQPPARQHRMLAPVARAAGGRVRRIGEALESWAAVSEPRRSASWRSGGRA